MRIVRTIAVAVLMALGLGAVGCSSKTGEHAESSHDVHAHAETGPHGGELVELGDEEYHAEVLHATEAVVYLLDGTARNAVPIDAPELVVNVSHDGKSEQFRLAATPDAEDPMGKSSRFASNDAELVADLNDGHADVQLVVTFSGTQYRGTVIHDYEHAEE